MKKFHKTLLTKKGRRGRVPLSPFLKSVATQQTANNADAATDEQEHDGEQQEGSIYDSVTQGNNKRGNSSRTFGNLTHEGSQSRSFLKQTHLSFKIKKQAISEGL